MEMCSDVYVGQALLGRGGGLESMAAGCFPFDIAFDIVPVPSLTEDPGSATELDGATVCTSLDP